MNNFRKEEIEDKARGLYGANGGGSYGSGYMDGWITGAEWADTNPGWISTEDDNPENHEEFMGYADCPYKSKPVIILRMEEGGPVLGIGIRYQRTGEDGYPVWEWSERCDFWMPFPRFKGNMITEFSDYSISSNL